jgi:hypothetical protein
MDEGDRIPWEDADEGRMVHRLFEFAAARESLSALDETTELLGHHDGLQPQYASTYGRLIARNRLILAKSLPSPMELARLLGRDKQLNLWGRAA